MAHDVLKFKMLMLVSFGIRNCIKIYKVSVLNYILCIGRKKL